MAVSMPVSCFYNNGILMHEDFTDETLHRTQINFRFFSVNLGKENVLQEFKKTGAAERILPYLSVEQINKLLKQ